METGWTRGVVTVELLEPAGRARGGVLVVHSWWGLTDSFRRYGAALAAEGYRVGLADLFGGATATTEDEARALRAARRPRPDYRTLSAGLDAVRGAAADLPLATVGFSMGGHWAAWLAGRAAYGLSAAVLYYAARASHVDGRAGLLAHFAAADPWVSASARGGMERALHRAGRRYVAHDYPGTGHWFAESARPDAYDPEASMLALTRDIAFLSAHLDRATTGAGGDAG